VAAAFLRRRLPADAAAHAWEGDPTALLDAWEGAARVWLVDAVVSGAPPGTVHRVDAGAGTLPAGHRGGSTHQLGLAETVELGRALHRLPGGVIVYGVEGASFALGAPVSAAVREGARRAARAIRAEMGATAGYCA
jgi:hydrogenase maturation protease